jgi:hypothetical protein
MTVKTGRTVACSFGALIFALAGLGCSKSATLPGGTGGNGNQQGSSDLGGSASSTDMATGSPSGGGSGGSGSGGGGSAGGGTTASPDMVVLGDAAKFVGTWTYGAGAVATTTSCLTEPPTTDISADTFTVTLKSADTITFAGGAALNCNFDFTVAGDIATLVPGQTCMITVMGINLTVTPSSASMTTSDGMTAMLSAQGSVNIGQCTVGLNAPAATKM